MIKKIKKYKVSVHAYGVSRILKKRLGLKNLPEDLEKTVENEIAETQKLAVPCAVYDSYSKSETPELIKPLWDHASENSLALSLFAVTIGAEMENKIVSSQTGNGSNRTAVLDSIAREMLEQSLVFVTKLLAGEAKAESCELSPVFPVKAELLGELLSLLESHKADITVDAEGRVLPLFSAASYCFWNPIPKSRSAKR